MSHILVTITFAAGSTPRDTGTQMQVWADRISGTIGGGALEWQVMKTARDMLTDGRQRHRETLPLGPSLGQCCGGSVVVEFERDGIAAQPTTTPVWIFGAGHVGRALVDVMAPLPQWQLTWIDVAQDRFPAIPDSVTKLIAAKPDQALRYAPKTAHHLIVTHSHEIDLALCHAALTHGFASCGVIGSATKWARFQRRLAALGHGPAQIARIACPIGDPSLGKHPQALAISVAHAMLRPGRQAMLGDKAG